MEDTIAGMISTAISASVGRYSADFAQTVRATNSKMAEIKDIKDADQERQEMSEKARGK